MSKLAFLFACVAILQIANALQCYHCEKEACEKPMDQWQKSQCAKSADPKLTAACLKNIYKDKTSQKETASRKCVYVDKSQKYKCGNVNGEEVLCETCESDLCNSAGRIGVGAVAVIGVALALLAPRIFA